MVGLTITDADKGSDPMATVATQSISAHLVLKSTPIIEQPAFQGPAGNAVKFDPKRHMAFKIPSKTLTMEDLGYPDDTGVSPVACSEPFQLFTPEAIQAMRAEIFKPEVREKCTYSSNIGACQLRGYAKE